MNGLNANRNPRTRLRSRSFVQQWSRQSSADFDTLKSKDDNKTSTRSKHSWVSEHFQRRECARFIPTSSDSDKCCCGRIKELHNENALLPPALQDSTWVSSRHTEASPTDAYGEIEFHGAGHCSRAKYIRLAHDTDPELAYRLLSCEWKIGLPKLLISVTGGAKNFVLQSKLKRILKDGLLKAAQTTGAWIITGGTNTGVMKHVGEAVRGHTVMSRGAQIKDSAHQVHLIGIASWGIVDHRDLLVNSKEPVSYHMTSSMKSKGACLDNNHSHFILVDNGTVDKYGVEISFRAKLENCIARKTMVESCEKSHGVPVVLFVLEGGPNTIRTVLESVSRVPAVPVVIAEGSGRAADVLAFAHRYIGPSRGEMTDVADVVEHRQLLHKIEKAFPGFDAKQSLTLYQSVLKCVAKREYITVFSVDEGTLDIDKAILRALLKGQNALPKHQLSLALVWDRADIAKSEIFAEDIKWKTCDLENAMMEALLQDKVEFVELLLENGISMSYFLTEKRLEELYRKSMDVSCTLRYILDKCKVHNAFVYSDLGNILDYLLGVRFNFAENTNQKDFISQSLSMYNAFLFSPASGSSCEQPMRFKTPFHELLVWSVLCNRRKMAVFMWERGEESLAKALVAGKLFKAIAKEMSKDDLLDDLCEGIERNAKEFYDISLGLLDECYHLREDATQKLLTYHLEYWGGQTCLSLAVAMQHEDFVAHSCCQSIMTEIWMGAMKAGKWSTLKTVLGILVPPFIFSLEFKSRKEMSSMPVTYEEFEAERMDTRNQAPQQVQYAKHSYENGLDVEPVVQLSGLQDFDRISLPDNHRNPEVSSEISWVKKVYEFHRAPITKFWANLIVYMMFLMLFSHLVLLKLEPSPKALEWLLIVFVVTLLLEEIRQVVQSLPSTPLKKIKEWASNNWNICDCCGIVLFFVAVALRFNPETLAIGHVVYSLDIMLWIIRLLDIFSVNKDLGPYVVMIGRMTLDMLSFLLIMVVFLLAYGVAQQAILFPNEGPSWELIPKILFRPYFQVYGELFIEDVDYSTVPDQTAFNTPRYNAYGGSLVTFIMAFYLLVANILLLNLLIAIFNNTFSVVQANANQIWKFQRYQLVMEYAQRPLLVPPFIVLGHVYRLLKACWRGSTNGRKKADRKLKLFLTKEELNKLMLFEEQCTESYLQKKAKVLSATQEERVKGIVDRVDSNAFHLNKISKVVHSLEDRHIKLEEYTLQVLDVVGHLQLMFPQSLTEHEQVFDSDGNEDEGERGQNLEGAGYDRYMIEDDRKGPVFDRMVSMPAYMHQKIPSPRSSPRMYFRNKLPLTNPYQYRKQFNNGQSVKKAVRKFRSNTLPRNLSKTGETGPETIAEYDQKDGYSDTPGRGSSHSQKRADSLDTPTELEVPWRCTRPRSSSMPSSSRNPTEYDNISRDHDLHIRARQSPYPNSELHRYPVPDFLVDWQMPFPGYFPVNYSDPSVAIRPAWADVDIADAFYQDVQLEFNAVDNGVDRRSHMGVYDLFDGIPRNPMGRTGLGGRGLLGRWGPNHAADPIVTRWVKNEEDGFFQRAGKRVLEFVAIQRCDGKEWAIPGGMVEAGETISETLKREFCEEALSSLEDTDDQRKDKCAEIKNFFANGIEIYKGYVDDPRNTDNAWIETVAINFHDETGHILNNIKLKAGDDACNVRWQEVSSYGKLYANHLHMLELVARHHGAYFD